MSLHSSDLLLVDDNADNLFVLKHLVEEHLPSCRVHLAAHAGAGLEIASRVALDGVLVDMQMPGMDGIDMCRALKSQESTRHIPVVLITSHQSSPPLRVRGLESGADDFISRPIDNIELVARIKGMLRIKRAEDRMRSSNMELEKRVYEQTRALRESQAMFQKLSQQFRTLLDCIPNPLMLLDPAMTVIWANRATSNYLQREITSLPGKTCRTLWLNQCGCCDNCPIIQCFQSGKTEENRFETADGRIWNAMAFPLLDAAGEVVNVIAMDIDVTEELKLRDEANRASRLASLGELSAGIAHEINNPNALIQLNIPMLIDSWPDIAAVLDSHYSRQGDFLLGRMKYSKMRTEIPRLQNGILDSAKRIKRIVEDLKHFVRHEGCNSFEAMNLNTPVQTAVRLVASTIQKSTDHFTACYAEGMPPVKGSLQGIEQVVVNLIINACQALANQDRRIELTTRFDSTAGMNVIEIRDEGTGIAPRDLPYITDPFFTTRREFGGTGLGLSVSARIIREHDGRLEFTSQPGRGTTVIVRLPIMS